MRTFNGKPMANTYSHNYTMYRAIVYDLYDVYTSIRCIHIYTMYRATILKFGKLFDLAKYLEHTGKF